MKTLRTLCAVLLVLSLVLCTSAPAFAVSAQYGTTQSFLQVLNDEDHRYHYMGIDDDDFEQVNVSFAGDNLDDIAVEIYFDPELDSVSMRSWYVISFDESDLIELLLTVNELNSDYKYATFVADLSDYSVDVKLDCPLRDDANAGEIAFDALYYIVSIIDEAYPELEIFAK